MFFHPTVPHKHVPKFLMNFDLKALDNTFSNGCFTDDLSIRLFLLFSCYNNSTATASEVRPVLTRLLTASSCHGDLPTPDHPNGRARDCVISTESLFLLNKGENIIGPSFLHFLTLTYSQALKF